MTTRRQPLMEISENDAPATNSTAANSRRKSGRAVRAPEKFVPDIPSSQHGNASAKRKRATEDVENDASDLEEEDDEEESDGSDEEESAGEEEVRESRKKATRKAKKPAAKKPKVNGASLHEEEESEAHAVRLPSRPKKGKKGTKVAIADKSAEGLYAEVYTSGRPMDEVVADWVAHYNDNNSEALTDLINLIIRSTGCEIEVTEDDINDPENIEGRLSDIQQEFQATNPSDYPLISKAKSSQTFKACLGNFFDLLIKTIHESGLMYDEVALLENLHSWVVTMSSSTTRAFRHTSAFIALTITSAMCSISKDLAEKSAKILRQYEGEKKKKQANKSRLAEFKKKVDDCESSTSLLEDTIKDFFDTVFVHRYRDVDPRIRADCVEALGTWIAEMPRVFFDGSYLRYLGWMLSDVHHPTRHEVVKQLARIMKNKDNAAGMRHFIERFRTRLVEIAIQDSEPSVRSTGVELINLIRDAGMLEPDDIDSVGKLIFDTEPKVRKAVVPFFTENIQDLYEVKVEEIGGEEALEEILGGDPEDFDSPREEWIKLKSLAEILSTYDTEDSEDMPSQINQAITGNLSSATESRFTCAAQALYDKMPELKDWEVLAGYLLFDHSAKAKGSEAERALKESFKPDESEEIILLDILTATVKINLTESSHLEKGKKSTKLELQEAREATARHLADIIPRLLKKFGASPKTATIVLRLEHALNLEVFQELRQDSTGYAKLLDEISAQFTRHADKNVLNEASASLLHARGYEDLEEVTESKMQLLWEDTTDTLRKINKAGEISVRGGFSIPALTELSSNLARLDKLSSISSCVEPLETDPGDDEPLAINILLDVVARGELSEPDPDIDSLEDEVVQSAIQSSIFYFMWKTRSLLESIASEEPILQDDVEHLKERKELFTNNLIRSLSSRASLDPVRLLATGTLLDLHALFVNMNTAKNSKAKDGDDAMEVDENDQYEHLQELVTEIGPEVQAEITSIFDACERQYAKKANKTRFLAEPGEDEEPQDIEDEPEDEEEEDVTDNERQGEILKAEQQLCELTGKIILAICAQVIDASGELKGKLRSRIQRNRTKLGPNFKDIVAYLDDPKQKSKKSHKSKAQQAAVAARKSAKSKEIVEEEEEEEDDPIEEEEPEEGTAEDLRRRELVDDNEAPVSVDDEEDQENGDAEGDEDDQEEVLGD